jgi:hypothetical protein
MPKPKTILYGPKTKVGAYIPGLDRNDQRLVAHLYACPPARPHDPFAPMCARGWNRSDGKGFSIFRGNIGDAGVCRVCRRRADAGLPPVRIANRKTRWI